MTCKCKKCERHYEYNADVGYATDICSPFCDGILQGRRSAQARIATLEAENAKLRECLQDLFERHCGMCEGYLHHTKALAMLQSEEKKPLTTKDIATEGWQ